MNLPIEKLLTIHVETTRNYMYNMLTTKIQVINSTTANEPSNREITNNTRRDNSKIHVQYAYDF